jgi:hypothetical protein
LKWVQCFMSLAMEGVAMKKGSLPLCRARSDRRRDVLQAGQAVEVSRGALAGQRGVLIRSDRGGRWIVRLDILTDGAVLEIDAAALIKLRKDSGGGRIGN